MQWVLKPKLYCESDFALSRKWKANRKMDKGSEFESIPTENFVENT